MTIRKVKVGILTFSDGRKYIHETLVNLNQEYQSRLAAALEATGEVEAIQGQEIIWTPEIAKRESQRLRDMGAEMTIFNYAIWAFPNLSVIATSFAPSPYLLYCNLHPSEPGMVAMLSSAGSMDQLGLTYRRVWGDIRERSILNKVMQYIRAAGALAHIKGETFGLFGGRPLGMYTAVANQDQWMKMFGVDVEHIEQYEIVRASEKVPEERVIAGLAFLEKYAKAVHYDGKALTPEKLKKTNTILPCNTPDHSG